MAQAKKTRSKTAARKKSAKKKSSGFSSHGISMLLAGVVIGSLGTIMWQGINSDDSNVGSGIRAAIEQSKQQTDAVEQTATVPTIKPEQQSVEIEFYTVLPGIEVVVQEDEEPEKPKPEPKPVVSESNAEKPENEQEVKAEIVEAKPQSAYMVQVGSYSDPSTADRQKVKLAFIGLSSTVQKVSIKGQGDFYRVHLGPFADFSKAAAADDRLKQEGIKGLLLKMSKSG